MKCGLLAISLALGLSLSCVAAEQGTATVAKKPSFSERHPKLHKTGRKIRRTCQVLLPVAQFGGAVAQILTTARL